MMAPTSRTTRTERLRGQAGSVMVEALVAAAIIAGGGAATIAAFNSTTRASHSAEREAEAVSLAEKELERVVTKPFAQINDCVTPGAGSGRSDDPRSWVQGSQLFVARNFRPKGGFATPPAADLSPANQLALEPIAVSNTSGCVLAEEDASSAGVEAGSKVNHTKVFRFISYSAQQCAGNVTATVGGSLASSSLLGSLQTSMTSTTTTNLNALCTAMSGQQFKRVTIAVVLNQLANGAGLKYPVYVSAIVPDPSTTLQIG
jgi:hypothetical protein